MSFFDTVKENVNDFFERRRQSQAEETALQEQFTRDKAQAYREQFAVASQEAALIQAKQKAMEATGLAKLRAMNTVHNMQNPANQNPQGSLGKLKEYMANNRLRREQNIKKTTMLRAEAARQKQDKFSTRKLGRIGNQPTGLRKRPLY